MNLYLLKQNENNGLYTYDSIVVIAKNEEQARAMTPYGSKSEKDRKFFNSQFWTNNPKRVSVTLLGKAVRGLEETLRRRLVLTSFNAG